MCVCLNDLDFVADWEALADLEPSKLLPVEELPEISKLSVEEPKVEGPKRRGRGTFTYKRDAMYSDRDFSESRFDDSEDNDLSRDSEKSDESLKCKLNVSFLFLDCSICNKHNQYVRLI